MSDLIPLPEEFLARLKSIVPPAQWLGVQESFKCEPDTAFRVNSLLADAQQVRDTLTADKINIEEVEAINKAFTVSPCDRNGLTHHALAENGAIYIQDAGSMHIANLVNAQPGEEILDLAAAPGGKTLFLADAMQNSGRIAAVEVVKNRFFQLQNNVKRSGATIIECYMKDGRKVGRQVPERFDKVLIDAPCSSESRFRVDQPDSFQYWSEKKIADMQRKQKQLLYSAIQACKPGGKIVYSTCSFAPEENEAVIDRQLRLWKQNLDIEPIELQLENQQSGVLSWGKQNFDQRLQAAVRILPNRKMSGFFVCVLRKKA